MIKASFARISEFAVALGFILTFATASSAQSLTTTGIGLVGGGVLGAGTGAIVGAAAHHHPIKGALIGGGLGAVAGGILGNALQKQEESQAQMETQVSEQQRQIEAQQREIANLKQEQETE
jgi:outer membrane lipoprotein SlyB